MTGAASATGIANIVTSARNRRSRTTRRSVDPSKIVSSGSRAPGVRALVWGCRDLRMGTGWSRKLGRLVIRRARRCRVRAPSYRPRIGPPVPSATLSRPHDPASPETRAPHMTAPRTIVDKIWADHVVDPGPRRAGRARRRPPPRPRGDLAAGVHRPARAGAAASVGPGRPWRPPTTRSRRRRATCRCSTCRRPRRSASSSATAPNSGSRSTASARRRRASSTSSARSSGLTQPGMTIVCGDSHTSTHGAFGALAFGIGTSEVEMVLATQTLLQREPKTLRGPGRRPARAGRLGQGHHPRADRPDRGRRRDRPRLRVPRRGHPGADHGTAHDRSAT